MEQFISHHTTESDEQLEKLIIERQSKLSRHAETQKELESLKENNIRDLSMLREERNRKASERGRLEAEQDVGVKNNFYE